VIQPTQDAGSLHETPGKLGETTGAVYPPPASENVIPGFPVFPNCGIAEDTLAI
jgi:hypothetical protein